MNKFLLALFLLPGTLSYCQTPTQYTYGTPETEDNFPMLRLSNGDFMQAGSTKNTGFGGKDVLVNRIDAAGALIWSRQYGGSGDETAISIAQTPDGGFIVGGETFSNDPNGDAFIFKIDASGILQWWKNYGGAFYDITYSVFPLASGDIVAAGLMETSTLDYEAFLMKTDQNGDTLWTKIIGVPGIDHAVTVIQTSDLGYLFVGKTLSVGQGSCDCFIVKTDANGDTLWTSVIGGAGWDESMDVIEQPSGYVICGGTNSEGNSNYDFFLMKIDFTGNLMWVKQYGGQWVEASYCVEEIPGSGFLIAGYTETYSYSNNRGSDSANAWIVKTDYNGDTLWSQVIGGNLKEECFSAAIIPPDNIAVSGYTASYSDSTETYIYFTDAYGTSGCTDRRTAPTVFSPNFVQGNYSFSVDAGYAVTTPSMSQMACPTQRTTVCIPTSIEDYFPPDGAEIFPNPVNTSAFTVRAELNIVRVNVYHMEGRVTIGNVIEPLQPTGTMTIPTPKSAGVYFVNVTLEDGTVVKQKLIVTESRD